MEVSLGSSSNSHVKCKEPTCLWAQRQLSHLKLDNVLTSLCVMYVQGQNWEAQQNVTGKVWQRQTFLMDPKTHERVRAWTTLLNNSVGVSPTRCPV